MSYDTYSKRARTESVFSTDDDLMKALLEFKKLPAWHEAAEVLSRIGNPFRMYELAEQVGLDNDEAKDVVHFLGRHQMVQTLPAGYRKLPKLVSFLRSVNGNEK